MNLIKLLYSPKGKINRAYHAFAHLINIVMMLISMYMILSVEDEVKNNYMSFLSGAFGFMVLNFIICTVMIHVKRFHDLGLSGFCIFWLVFPIVNLVFYCFLFFKKGKSHEDIPKKLLLKSQTQL